MSCLMGAVLPLILDNSVVIEADATVDTVVGFLCYGTSAG